MRKILFFIIFLLVLQNVLCQKTRNPCQPYINQISILIKEKQSLQNQLDDQDISLDSVQQKFLEEQALREKYQNLYYAEREKNADLTEQLDKINKANLILNIEKQKVIAQIQLLELDTLNKRMSINYLNIRVDSINRELLKVADSNSIAQSAFKEREKAIKSYEEIVKLLNSEAKDWISVSKKEVHFQNEEYDYGNEIFFIEYSPKSITPTGILGNQIYLVERIAKLITKYDRKVQLNLVGESDNGDNEERAEQSLGRSNELKDFIVKNFHVPPKMIRTSNLSKVSKRIGVSVFISK
ncbi:MAG: hypothetical protein QM737_09925 [Ferruginibacter sp.]